jgi:hypothetical protein
MDSYTRKYFFEEIEQLLESRPVEELKPSLIFLAEDGLPMLLDRSGNKAIGNLLGLLEAELGYLGDSASPP